MSDDQEDTELEEVEGAEQLGDAGKKALDAMKARLKAERQRVKELEPLAAKAREAEEATKSELQKAAEARAAADERAAKAELLLLKRDIAEEAGLPKSWASRLQGSTKEELEADAKALAKDLPTTARPASNGRPVADLKPAALPAGDGTTAGGFDADAWIRGKAAGK